VHIRRLCVLLFWTSGLVWPAASAGQVVTSPPPAHIAAPRTDQNSRTAHAQLLDKARRGGIDLYFAGDSITRRWGATDYPELLANWTQHFLGWNAANFGWGGDRTEHILWRLQNGELDDVHPKVVVLLAGTNNLGGTGPQDGTATQAASITRGITAVLDLIRIKAPGATIVLMGILPRSDNIALMPTIVAINRHLSALADGTTIRYLDISARLTEPGGRLHAHVTTDGLHLSAAGYQIWADALRPLLTTALGPPAAEDHAPPPTGNPAASGGDAVRGR
jgi:lysophospholipase L1-like esterase